MLLCTIPWTTVCTSLLFTLLFIKSQYTVFLFLYILLFFAHLIIIVFLFFLHILFAHPIVFCTSYCFFAHLIVLHFFYFIAHFTLISPFLTTCMPLCYVTLYNLYSYYFALSTERTWFDYISLLIIPCITIMWQIKKPWTLYCNVSQYIVSQPRVGYRSYLNLYGIGTCNSLPVPNSTFFWYFTLCNNKNIYFSEKISPKLSISTFWTSHTNIFSDNQMKAWNFFIFIKWNPFMF